MQEEQAKIINRFSQRTEQGIVAVPSHPYFERKITHKDTSYQNEWHEGICWEEAKTKCGGRADLQEGVEARRIKTSGSGKWEDLFYHFKRRRLGGPQETRVVPYLTLLSGKRVAKGRYCIRGPPDEPCLVACIEEFSTKCNQTPAFCRLD